MQENTNKKILVNSIILYLRLGVVAISGLFSTRFALQALGVVDYGLYSVTASIISFIAIINTVMVSTSQRYIAVPIGKNDIKEANKQFNVCLSIHIFIAFATLLFAEPLGELYINKYLSYDGDINNALMVFRISITASVITFIGVPYNGLLVAKENFTVYCVPDIVSHLLKLVLAYSLLYFFSNKLFVYASFMAILTAYPVIVYYQYCRKHYHEISRWNIVKNKQSYVEILKFSGWVGYGALAHVGKAQGAAVLVNAFFNTIMNTALGIANSINAIILMVAQNVAHPIAPQITKSYAAGNRQRSVDLLVLSTKLTFIVMFTVASPFLVETEWIMSLWLGNVPPYAVKFTLLVIADALIDSLNSGIKNIIFADGNIKLFQIVPSTLKLFAIVAAYFVLKNGGPAYSLLYAYIIFTIIIFVANQCILHKTIHLDNSILVKRSYLPSLFIVLAFIPAFFVKVHPLIHILISLTYLFMLIFFIGFNNTERRKLIDFSKKLIHRKK